MKEAMMLQEQGHQEKVWVRMTPLNRRVVFILLMALCVTPWMSPPLALLLGILVAQAIGHPFQQLNAKATGLFLKVSVVGLGFGMNVHTAVHAGREGFLFTVVSILGTLLLGTLFGWLFAIDRKTTHLLSCGTAICGGSAIAAVAPVLGAEEKQISVALGAVFILNSVALFVFPAIGHVLHLSQTQFGLWCAIAIHDTSSVVGAASRFGPQALAVATTVKLARALWIIPIAFGSALLFRSAASKVKVPWFIGLFVIALLLNTYVPGVHSVAPYLVAAAKAGLTVTLFLIGSGLSRRMLRAVGPRPLLLALLLWVIISLAALWAVSCLVI
jgi:uncharacterized integral membrane protein (TIGR00698 family)